MTERRKIGLALGAGAARGLAHIGVIKVFQEQGFQFDCISGCSAGAIFGAFYAAGVDFQILEKLAYKIDEPFLIDLTVPKWGILRGERIEAIVRLLTKGRSFEDLEIPFYVMAVDVEEGETVVIEKGRLSDAVRASIAVPGVFVPKRMEGRLLVDGAVLDPVPVGVLRQRNTDAVVAVDVYYSVADKGPVKITNAFELLYRSLSLTGRAISKKSLENADLVIRPPVGHLSPVRFGNVRELIQLGYQAAMGALPELERIFAGGEE